MPRLNRPDTMSISYDKRNKRWRFWFARQIAGRRERASRLLPKGWTRAQAEQYDKQETARLYALASGIERPRHLIDDAVLAYLRDRGPALKNLRSLMAELNAMLPAYTGRYVDELPAVAAQYARDMTDQVSPATIRNRIAYLRAACRWAWKHAGMSEHDPAERLAMPQVQNARQVYLTRAQAITIARAANRRSRQAILTAFYSGMRLGELLRAEVTPDGFLLADTKNGQPRLVPIHPKLVGWVRRRWPIQTSLWTVSKDFKAAARVVGLGHARFHDLRHSTASAMINAGVDLYTVGGVLGHRSTVSTKRYAHLATATLAEALRKVR